MYTLYLGLRFARRKILNSNPSLPHESIYAIMEKIASNLGVVCFHSRKILKRFNRKEISSFIMFENSLKKLTERKTCTKEKCECYEKLKKNTQLHHAK